MAKYSVKIFWKKHSTQILTAVSVVGFVGTVVTAVKATPKAQQILLEKEKEKEKPLTVLEKVKYAAPCYIPTAAVGVATIACIVSTNALDRRRSASIAGSYALVSTQFNKYKNAVKDIYGKEAHEEIMRHISVVPCEPTEISATGGMYCAGFDIPDDDEKLLFYEPVNEVYFNATYISVLQALYHTNRNFVLRGYMPFDEYYRFLGLECDSQIGWSIDDEFYFIDFDIYKTVTDDGLVYYTIEPVFQPTADYMREWM